ncbi:hypothetical protein BHM03_00035135 [Ensete ventricosum]|nr:hypothetical protein BHM03_00035135 [Ensete ventricosum]
MPKVSDWRDEQRLDRSYPGNRAAANGCHRVNRPGRRLNRPYLVSWWLTTAVDPPRPMAEPPILRFFGWYELVEMKSDRAIAGLVHCLVEAQDSSNIWLRCTTRALFGRGAQLGHYLAEVQDSCTVWPRDRTETINESDVFGRPVGMVLCRSLPSLVPGTSLGGTVDKQYNPVPDRRRYVRCHWGLSR